MSGDVLAGAILGSSMPNAAPSVRVLGSIVTVSPLMVLIPSCSEPVSAEAYAHVSPVAGKPCTVDVFGRGRRIVAGVLP